MKNKESCFKFNRWKYNFFFIILTFPFIYLLHYTSQLPTRISFSFVNEKIKCWLSFSLIEHILTIQYNTIQLFYCFISFHMRHSQNTFINMFNRNAKNDISFSIMLNKRSIWKKKISILLCRTGFICWMQKFCYFFNCRTTEIQKVDKLIFII